MKNHTTNKSIVIILWTISLAVIGILLLQTYLESGTEVPQQIQSDTTQNTANKEALSPLQFKDNFNAASNKFNSNIKIESINFQTGLYQDTFNIRLQKNINLLGTLDEKGRISSITVIGLNDYSLGTEAYTTMTIAISIATFNPNLTLSDCYEVIQAASPSQTSSSGETVSQGYRYFYTRTADNKIMFSISKASAAE